MIGREPGRDQHGKPRRRSAGTLAVRGRLGDMPRRRRTLRRAHPRFAGTATCVVKRQCHRRVRSRPRADPAPCARPHGERMRRRRSRSLAKPRTRKRAPTVRPIGRSIVVRASSHAARARTVCPGNGLARRSEWRSLERVPRARSGAPRRRLPPAVPRAMTGSDRAFADAAADRWRGGCPDTPRASPRIAEGRARFLPS